MDTLREKKVSGTSLAIGESALESMMAHHRTSDFWRDRPTFVTGATGIWSVDGWSSRWSRQGADVVCLVRDWIPDCETGSVRPLWTEVKIVRGDICDQEMLERALGEHEIDTVIHLAAQTIVGIANRNPVSTFEANIAGTWRLLEACRRSPRVKQIVIASSDKAYGDQEHLPYDETTPLQGQHPYDVSKSCADLISYTYAKSYDLPVTITRCGNFYGGGDLNWNRIVPGTIRSVLRGQAPVIRLRRQFCPRLFLCGRRRSGLHAAGRKPGEEPERCAEKRSTSPLNCKSPCLDLTQKILALMGSDLTPDIRNEASNEIKHQYLSAAKARRMLDWEPLFTLDRGPGQDDPLVHGVFGGVGRDESRPYGKKVIYDRKSRCVAGADRGFSGAVSRRSVCRPRVCPRHHARSRLWPRL